MILARVIGKWDGEKGVGTNCFLRTDWRWLPGLQLAGPKPIIRLLLRFPARGQKHMTADVRNEKEICGIARLIWQAE